MNEHMENEHMENIQQLSSHLDDLAVAPAVREYVAAVTARRPVLSDRRGDYVSLRPTVDRPIAVYVHANRVSIACEPAKAASMAWPGRKQKATPATTYMILDAAPLPAARAHAEDLAVDALHWRSSGPTQVMGRARAAAAARVEDICPDCWRVITPAGTCCCDE